MASRQFLRRLSPVFRAGFGIRSMFRPSAYLHRQAVLGQDLASRLTVVRFNSTAVQPDIINIQNEQDFEERVIQAQKPIVVDFHATWCGPCKLLGPRLETIVAGMDGKVTMAKVDIDENVELAMKYNVQSVPTVYFLKNGKVLKAFVGLKEDDEIKGIINSLL